MEKLTNEEIARVFAMYLHSKVVFDNHIGNIHTYYLPAGKYKVGKMWFVSLEDEHDKELSFSVSADKVKLLLAPLSKITDEHAMACWEVENYMCSEHDIPYVSNLFKEMSGNLFQYLIQQGYSVPLFFGLNHWANGKTPIELGIAIESL